MQSWVPLAVPSLRCQTSTPEPEILCATLEFIVGTTRLLPPTTRFFLQLLADLLAIITSSALGTQVEATCLQIAQDNSSLFKECIAQLPEGTRRALESALRNALETRAQAHEGKSKIREAPHNSEQPGKKKKKKKKKKLVLDASQFG